MKCQEGAAFLLIKTIKTQKLSSVWGHCSVRVWCENICFFLHISCMKCKTEWWNLFNQNHLVLRRNRVVAILAKLQRWHFALACVIIVIRQGLLAYELKFSSISENLTVLVVFLCLLWSVSGHFEFVWFQKVISCRCDAFTSHSLYSK